MTKSKGTKPRTPAVYVERFFDISHKDCVRVPVDQDGGRIRMEREWRLITATMCYQQFSRITGIKLKSGKVTKVRITGKIIKE